MSLLLLRKLDEIDMLEGDLLSLLKMSSKLKHMAKTANSDDKKRFETHIDTVSCAMDDIESKIARVTDIVDAIIFCNEISQ